MRLYLSGPMTGIPEHNVPLFTVTAAALRSQGHEVVNPAENFDGDLTLPWDVYLRLDIKQLCDCEAIAVLPGWEASRGARLEVCIARALGMPMYHADTMEAIECSSV